MIRIVLPHHLRNLAGLDSEVEIAVEGAQVTDGTVLVRFVEEQSAPTAATG